MKVSKNSVGLSWLAILPLVVLIAGQMAQANIGRTVGKVSMVRGSVWVDGKAVQNGAPVREKSVIETKDDSVVTVLLGKGTAFYIGANSKMVVNEFGVAAASGEEKGSLDLKFGRTRALVLNKGMEKRDLKIKARAATMGVRGTEVYISNPVNDRQPIEFITLEGSADVVAPGAQQQIIGQGQGVSFAGGPNNNSNNNSNNSDGRSSNANSRVETVKVDVEQVREQIKAEGLAPPPALNLRDVEASKGGEGAATAAAQTGPVYGGAPGDTNSSNGVFTTILTTETQNNTQPANSVNVTVGTVFCPVTSPTCP